jgi:hypothetical protein
MIHGQMHTLIDLLKDLNQKEPIKDADDAVNRLKEIMQENIRWGDRAAIMVMRTIWELVASDYKGAQDFDMEKLEQDLMHFHDGRNGLLFSIILYHYSVAKTIKYLQFTNEFMRYKSYDEVLRAMETIGFGHCVENDPGYYFGFSPYTLRQLEDIMREEWSNISYRGALDNERLEHVFFGRFESVKRRFYNINGSNIEKGCSDFSIEDESFEMRFAKRLLADHPAYEMIGRKHRSRLEDTYYVPKEDFTLPVYSEVLGKLKFDSQEEKEKKIRELKDKREEYAG